MQWWKVFRDFQMYNATERSLILVISVLLPLMMLLILIICFNQRTSYWFKTVNFFHFTFWVVEQPPLQFNENCNNLLLNWRCSILCSLRVQLVSIEISVFVVEMEACRWWSVVCHRKYDDLAKAKAGIDQSRLDLDVETRSLRFVVWLGIYW